MGNKQDLEKRIEVLEERLKIAEERIVRLSANMNDVPSRFEFDSLMRQTSSGGSIFDGIF